MSTFWPRLSGIANLPVNQQGQKLRTITKKFAPQKRGRPTSRLQAANVVNVPQPVLRDIYVTFAPKPRGKRPQQMGLSEPTVVGAFVPPSLVYTDTLVVSLSPFLHGQQVQRRSMAGVRPPGFVATPPAVLRDIAVLLASQRRSKPPPSKLGQPAVVGEVVPPTVVYTDTISVVLASQRRGKGSLVLVRPIVVFGPPGALGWIAVSLAPQKRGKTKPSVLRPPAVVSVAAADVFGGIMTVLVPARPPQIVKSVLRKPVLAAEVFPGAKVVLAFRGRRR